MSLTSNDTFTLDLIDKAKEQAIAPQLDSSNNKTVPRLRPVKVAGYGEVFVMYLHDQH